MAEDKSKIDSRNIDNPEYDEIAEDQRQALEIQLKEIEAEAKNKLISCYGKTRQGVIKKEKFVLPTLSSSTTSTDAPEITAPVSTTTSNVTLAQVENLFAERDVRLVNLFTKKFLILTGRQPVIYDTSPVSTVVSTEIPVPQPSVTLPASQPPYGMPMHYFSGQTVTPTNALVAQQTYSDPLTSVHSSANFYRTHELENSTPPYSTYACNMPPVPPRSTMPQSGPMTDEMFDRYVQRWQNKQQPVRPTPSTGQTGSPQPIKPIVSIGQTSSPGHATSNRQIASTSMQPNSSINLEKFFVECTNDLGKMIKENLGVDIRGKI